MKPVPAVGVKQVVGQMLGVDPALLVRSQRLVIDLGADSLDMIEIVMATEEEFQIEITDEVAEKFTTIGDIIDYVEKRLEAGVAP